MGCAKKKGVNKNRYIFFVNAIDYRDFYAAVFLEFAFFATGLTGV